MSIGVKVFDGNIELALKKFKRKIKKSNIMIEFYEKSYYKKPSVKKKEKRQKAIARNKYKVIEEKESEL